MSAKNELWVWSNSHFIEVHKKKSNLRPRQVIRSNLSFAVYMDIYLLSSVVQKMGRRISDADFFALLNRSTDSCCFLQCKHTFATQHNTLCGVQWFSTFVLPHLSLPLVQIDKRDDLLELKNRCSTYTLK